MNNLAFAFHVSWPWMLVLLPIIIGTQIYALSHMPLSPTDIPVGFLVVSIVAGLSQAIAFASIAVNWHRYVLLDEIPHGAQRLRIDTTVWRYFGNIILMVLILMACALPLGVLILILAYTMREASLFLVIPFYIAAALAAFSASYRLSIKLPAIALGRRDFGFREAYSISAGNFWQMLGFGMLLVLVAISVGLVSAGIGFVTGAMGGNPGLALGVAIQLVAQWAMTILGITGLTSLYGYFVESRNF